MTSAATMPDLTEPDARAKALVGSYVRAGYQRVAPALIQPAEPFLDLSGEDIRQRMFLTTDRRGTELCLRPDLTIPVARSYLGSAAAGKPSGFCYLGPVFRYRGDSPGEFVQAGVESFGRKDIAAADAEMLSLGLEATMHYGLKAPSIRLGDVGLFSAFVASIDLPDAWKRRIRARTSCGNPRAPSADCSRNRSAISSTERPPTALMPAMESRSLTSACAAFGSEPAIAASTP